MLKRTHALPAVILLSTPVLALARCNIATPRWVAKARMGHLSSTVWPKMPIDLIDLIEGYEYEFPKDFNRAWVQHVANIHVLGDNADIERQIETCPKTDWFPFQEVEAKGKDFFMGSLAGQDYGCGDESRVSVTLTHDFEVMNIPVTQFHYSLLMKRNPARFQANSYCKGEYRTLLGVSMCPNHPQENVTWHDAQAFVAALNEEQRKEDEKRGRSPSYHYRLLTEAEWEYIAKAGLDTPRSYGLDEDGRLLDGNDASLLGDHAWYYENSPQGTQAVARRKPNAWGFYDLYGNVWEWTLDIYRVDLATLGLSQVIDNDSKLDDMDPRWLAGAPDSVDRVLRGGSWKENAKNPRSAKRGRWPADERYALADTGLRLLRTKLPSTLLPCAPRGATESAGASPAAAPAAKKNKSWWLPSWW